MVKPNNENEELIRISGVSTLNSKDVLNQDDNNQK
jgi:hypothetical protein